MDADLKELLIGFAKHQHVGAKNDANGNQVWTKGGKTLPKEKYLTPEVWDAMAGEENAAK